MKSLIHEIHRRSLWQVLGIYLAGSWVALQVVETLSESMTLPDWVQGFSVILLVLGLPVVLATAFVQEGVGGRGDDLPADPGADADDEIAPSSTAADSRRDGAAPARSGAHGLFTWRRAIAGGVVAFALLGLALVGWVTMRSLGVGPAATLVAKGVLEDQATLLLTDFVADDESLSRAATEAIRVDLNQSNVVDIADPGFVLAALGRMERSPEDGLDVATGRDLAQREGIPAVISGEVTSVGEGYVLTAQILTTGTGEVLVADRVTADDDADLIAAIDRLSRKLRERIGETLGDLAATPPLERVTTADLAALRLYSRAVALSDEGAQRQAADLLEEAVALDSSFAMAWRKLGAIHTSAGGALGELTRGIEAYRRAFESRERLTERERLLTVASYYSYVELDPRRGADAYEEMLRSDPDDTWALNNLAILMGGPLGDPARADELLRRAIDVEPESPNAQWNLSVQMAEAGDYDAAGETLEGWKSNVPGDAMPYLFHAALAASMRRFDEADSVARVAMTIRPGNTLDQSFGLGNLSMSALVRGKIREGYRLAAEATEHTEELGAGRALGTALDLVEYEIDTRGDPGSASERLAAALGRYRVEDMGPLDPPWSKLVRVEARVHGPARGRQRLADWESADPKASSRAAYDVTRAWLDIAGGDPSAALRRLDGATDIDCIGCAPYARLEAARLLGEADSILVYGEAFIDYPDMFRTFDAAGTLAPTHEDLARRYDELGDLENAARHYAAFVELWAEADAELQPRVRTAQARLEEILRETG